MSFDRKPATAEPGKKFRQFQFGLRAVLIGFVLLAIPLGYVGRQAEIVRERKSMLETIRKSGGSSFPFASVDLFGDGPALWCRSLFGDPGFGLIYLPKAMSAQTDAIQKLFPESTIAPLKSWRGDPM